MLHPPVVSCQCRIGLSSQSQTQTSKLLTPDTSLIRHTCSHIRTTLCTPDYGYTRQRPRASHHTPDKDTLRGLWVYNALHGHARMLRGMIMPLSCPTPEKMKYIHESAGCDGRNHRLLMQEHVEYHANIPWCDEHAFVSPKTPAVMLVGHASHAHGWLTGACASHGLCWSCTRRHASAVMLAGHASHACCSRWYASHGLCWSCSLACQSCLPGHASHVGACSACCRHAVGMIMLKLLMSMIRGTWNEHDHAFRPGQGHAPAPGQHGSRYDFDVQGGSRMAADSF